METGTARIWRLAVLASVAAHIGVGTVMITLSPVSAGSAAGGPLSFERMYLLPREEQPKNDLTLTPPPERLPSEQRPQQPPRAASRPVQAPVMAPPPESMKVPLGADNGSMVITPTWLANTAEGEHAARQFENDQPQLDRVQKSQPGGTPGAAGQDGENGSPAAAAPPVPTPGTPEKKAQEAREKKDEVPDLHRTVGPLQEEVKIGSDGGMLPEKELPATAPKAQEKVTPQEKIEAAPAVPAVAATPTPPSPTPLTPDPSQPTPTGPVGKAGAPGAPGNPGAAAKVAADRESDATSIKAAAVYRNGRVTTGEGLDIKTVRPELSLTTQTLRTPESPVLRILFGRDGRVKDVKVLKSSGYPEAVDSPVVSAAFNWRASGKILATLPNHPGATLALEITIVLQ